MRTLGADLRLPHGLALLVGPLLAVLVYASTLQGSFLSDDVLLNVLLVDEGNPPDIDWAEVFADFHRGWLALGESYLYRPMVTLSVAVNYMFGGADPFGFHVFNVLFHAVATFAAGLLCGLCCPYRPSLAAMLGGALFALHPAAAETACWIAARNSGMEVMWRLLAMAGFALYLRRGLRRDMVLAVTASVFACLTKETAVMIPVGFLALDLLMTPTRPLAARLRLHLAFAPIWLGYFMMRKLVLGVFLDAGTDESGGAWQAMVFLHNKLVMVFVPFLTGFPVLRQGMFYVFLIALVVWAVREPLVRDAVVFGFGWLMLNYAPAYRLDVPSGLFGGRMLYGSVAVMAIIVCMLAVRLWDTPRFVPGTVPEPLTTPLAARLRRLGVPAAMFSVLALFTWSTSQQIQRYHSAYEQAFALQHEVQELSEQSSPERPLVILRADGPPGAALVARCDMLFTLAEIPIAPRDRPLVSLGFVWEPVPPLSQSLLGDSGPIRAMRHLGSPLLLWNPSIRKFVDLSGQGGESSPVLPELLEEGPRRLFALAPCDALGIEAVKLVVVGRCDGGTLTWLRTTEDGPMPLVENGKVTSQRGFRGGIESRDGRDRRDGKHTTFHVDLSHEERFVRLQRSLAGFQVSFADGAARRFSLEAIARLPELDLQRRLAGDRLVLGEEGRSLKAPSSQDPSLQMFLVLLGPNSGAQLAVKPGMPVQFPSGWRAFLGQLNKCLRQKLYYYYFEARSPQNRSLLAYRSPVDWFVLTR